jgi:hypothetical protein
MAVPSLWICCEEYWLAGRAVRSLSGLRRPGSAAAALVVGAGTLLLCGCNILRPRPASAPANVTLDCATGIVVGLSWQPSDPAPAGGYEISRDGVTIGRTPLPSYSDLTVAPGSHYTYIVSAVGADRHAAAAPAIEADTAAVSAQGDAPYCPSSLSGSITFDWSQGYNEPNGSDLWPMTWGSDGVVYAFFGDGGGIGGDNHRGRVSFGIASFTGAPPEAAATARNVYGGYHAAHPASINGKASSIIAVGNDFYIVGGIFTSDEAARKQGSLSGAPDRIQLGYSRGNPYSWQASWTFCAPDKVGRFCPLGFVNFGRGNRGARDRYVYLLGVANEASLWRDDLPASEPGLTYLARVPSGRLLSQRAYRFFSGLDRHGRPLWDRDAANMQPVFVDRNASRPGCGGVCNMSSSLLDVVFDFGLHRYLGVAQGGFVGQTSFYEAPEIWGPWRMIQYNNIEPASGAGGWAGLGKAGGGSIGVHIVNAWTSPDGLGLWLSYSSDGKAPPGATFPPAGTSMDSLNLVPARLNPR